MSSYLGSLCGAALGFFICLHLVPLVAPIFPVALGLSAGLALGITLGFRLILPDCADSVPPDTP